MRRFIISAICFLFISQCLFSQSISVISKSNWRPVFYNSGFSSIYIDGNIIYASDYNYGIYKSIDDGKNFVSLNNFNNLMIDANYTYVFAKDETIFLSTQRGLLRSTDFGFSWSTNTNINNVKKIFFENDTIFAAAEYRGYIFSTDNGDTWIQKNEGLPFWNGLRSFNKSGCHLMVGIGSEGLFYSSNNGDSWEKRNNGLTSPWIEDIVSIDNVFYIASGDGFSKTTDFGQNWTQINEGCYGGSPLISDGNYLYASTWGNGIFRREKDGSSWELFYLDYDKIYPYLTSLNIKDSKIYLSTIKSTNSFAISEDNGNTWTKPNSSSFNTDESRNINCFYEINSYLFAGTSGGLFKSTDHGVTWVRTGYDWRINTAPIMQITYFDNSLYLATQYGVLKTTDWGVTWENLFSNMTRFINVVGNNLYIGTYYDGIYLSTDKGTTWNTSNEGLTDLYVSSMICEGTSFYLTTNSGLFKSTNSGQNWSVIFNSNGDQLYSICQYDSTIFIGGWYSIYRSSDDGENWLNLNTSGAINFYSIGTKLYALGDLKCTTDEGVSWTSDKAGLPNNMFPSLHIFGSKMYIGTNGKGIYQKIDFSGDLGSINVGKKSESFSYWINTLKLNGNLTITAPEGFEVSLTPLDGFSSSIAVTPEEGYIIYKEIFVRFAPTEAKTYSSNISHTSNGATTQYLAVTGIGVAVLPEVTTTNPTNISASKASTGGNVTFDGGAAISSRGICFNKTGSPTCNDIKTNDGTGKGVFTSNIKGLRANTKYYAKAFATNSVGTAYGEEITFTTGNPELSVLTTSQVSSITSNSATSGGTITDNGGVDILYKGVCWNLTGNPTFLDSKTNDGAGIDAFESSIVNLTPNKKYYVRAYAANSVGTSYGDEISFSTPSIVIQLNQGWNMISSNVVPKEPNAMASIFSNVLENVVIVKDNTGKAFIPTYDIDDIGSWDVTQGYQIYMASKSTLNIFGEIVDPKFTPIILSQGWNMIAYLGDSPLDCETAFESLNDDNNLIIVKDNEGHTYIPSYGINDIGNLVPGNGYQIYVLNIDFHGNLKNGCISN
jgi:photosystem II stability/assembly factor-like uncharacterized protein